jgi:hypothetical protein
MTLQELLADPPKLHVFRPVPGTRSEKMFAPGELIDRWKLSDEELRFIDRHVDSGSKTLETGAGCSTVLFAMKHSHHTCIVPDRALADRIVAYCRDKGIATDRLTFIIEPSERALPALATRDFDLALIDGRHGFPQPFLDWYFIAERLKVGGYVIIDDLHVWVCETLVNLLAEEQDWRLVHESLGGAALQKLGDSTQNNEFPAQPFVRRHSRMFSFRAKVRYLWTLLRRRNYPLLARTLRLGVQSALQGTFGERPGGRR